MPLPSLMTPAEDRPGADPAPDTEETAALRARVAALEAEAAVLRRGLAAPDGAALRQILDSVTGYAVVTTDLDRRILAWNEGARRLFGWTEAEALGRRCDLMFTPEDRADGVPERETAAALSQGRAADERWHARRDGSRFWGSGFLMPLRGPGGPPRGLVKIMRDGTAEREAENRLRDSEERLRQIVETIEDVFWISQPSPPRLAYVSPAFERVWGIPPDGLFRQQTAWLDTVHPADRDRVREAFYERALAEGRYDVEYRILRPDGSVRWVHDRGRPVAGPGDEAPRRLAGLASDVTARHEAEERRRLLVAELNHRVKNTLATVQSLAHQTGRAAGSAGEFTAAFEGRLLALARAHDLLTREDWRGATVADVAGGALAPHLASGRVSLAGPALRIGPREAVALAMALGELASNAAKHGALSAEGGRVSVSWRAEADDRHGGGVLLWEESGGPPVAAPPARRGFGLRMLVQGLRQDLRAAAELDFAPGGLRCAIRLPAAGA
jgi:PAS domain S-box-containing protein